MTDPAILAEPDPGPGFGWVRTLDPIADAYGAAMDNPSGFPMDVRESWRALAASCETDARAIRSGSPVRIVGPDGEIRFRALQVSVSDDPEPYATPADMAADAAHNGRFVVSRANCEHPLWMPETNVAFRIVHDVRGHLATGGDFGWVGENRACDGHRRAINRAPWSTRTRRAAARAMFCECIAQTGYAIARGGFPDQICELLPNPIAAPLPTSGGFYAEPCDANREDDR